MAIKTVGTPMMFRTQENEIAPGETITFRILYENAPASMKSFRVTFGKIERRNRKRTFALLGGYSEPAR